MPDITTANSAIKPKRPQDIIDPIEYNNAFFEFRESVLAEQRAEKERAEQVYTDPKSDGRDYGGFDTLLTASQNNLDTGNTLIRPGGSVSTSSSIVVEVDEINGGRPTVIPTIYGGVQVGDRDAVGRAIQSKNRYPSGSNIKEAEQISVEAHNQMARQTAPPFDPGTPDNTSIDDMIASLDVMDSGPNLSDPSVAFGEGTALSPIAQMGMDYFSSGTEEIYKGLARGTPALLGSVTHVAGMAASGIGEMTGDPAFTELSEAIYKKGQAIEDVGSLKEFEADVPTFEQVKDPLSFSKWALGSIGEQIPNLTAYSKGYKAGQYIGSGLGKFGKAIGGGAGAYATGVVLEAGGTFSDMMRSTGTTDHKAAAMTAASIISLLDIIAPIKWIKKLGIGKKAIQESANKILSNPKVKGTIREAIESAAIEGITEPIQEIVGAVAHEWETGAKGGFLSDEFLGDLWKSTKEANAKGILMGFGMGASTGLRDRPQIMSEKQLLEEFKGGTLDLQIPVGLEEKGSMEFSTREEAEAVFERINGIYGVLGANSATVNLEPTSEQIGAPVRVTWNPNEIISTQIDTESVEVTDSVDVPQTKEEQSQQAMDQSTAQGIPQTIDPSLSSETQATPELPPLSPIDVVNQEAGLGLDAADQDSDSQSIQPESQVAPTTEVSPEVQVFEDPSITGAKESKDPPKTELSEKEKVEADRKIKKSKNKRERQSIAKDNDRITSLIDRRDKATSEKEIASINEELKAISPDQWNEWFHKLSGKKGITPEKLEKANAVREDVDLSTSVIDTQSDVTVERKGRPLAEIKEIKAKISFAKKNIKSLIKKKATQTGIDTAQSKLDTLEAELRDVNKQATAEGRIERKEENKAVKASETESIRTDTSARKLGRKQKEKVSGISVSTTDSSLGRTTPNPDVVTRVNELTDSLVTIRNPEVRQKALDAVNAGRKTMNLDPITVLPEYVEPVAAKPVKTKRVKVDKPKVEPKESTDTTEDQLSNAKIDESQREESKEKTKSKSIKTEETSGKDTSKASIPGSGKMTRESLLGRVADSLNSIPKEDQDANKDFGSIKDNKSGQLTHKESMGAVVDTVINETEKAIRIAEGTEATPEDHLQNAYSVVLSQYMDQMTPSQRARYMESLNTTSNQSRRHGQEIEILSQYDVNNPARYIMAVNKARADNVSDSKLKEASQDTKIKGKDMLSKSLPSKGDWIAFVRSIRC